MTNNSKISFLPDGASSFLSKRFYEIFAILLICLDLLIFIPFVIASHTSAAFKEPLNLSGAIKIFIAKWFF